MLPAIWNRPPCMNIEEKIVRIGDGRSAADAPARHQPELLDEGLPGPRALHAAHLQRDLVEEDQRVGHDQADGDDRGAVDRVVVFEREQGRYGAAGPSVTTVRATRCTSSTVTASTARS